MRTNRLRSICAMGLVLAGITLAQSPDITSFHGNGQLTWTNSDTNLFYQVQWAASLTASNAWRASYSPLRDIQSTNDSITVSVPMFYRICGSSNRVFYSSPVAKTGQTSEYATGYNPSAFATPSSMTFRTWSSCGQTACRWLAKVLLTYRSSVRVVVAFRSCGILTGIQTCQSADRVVKKTI